MMTISLSVLKRKDALAAVSSSSRESVHNVLALRGQGFSLLAYLLASHSPGWPQSP